MEISSPFSEGQSGALVCVDYLFIIFVYSPEGDGGL